LVSINRVAAELMGDTVDELLARMPTESYDPKLAVESKAREHLVCDGMGVITFELTAGHRDGSDRHPLVTKYPVCNAEGTVIGVGGCLGGCF
jgi:hypothetical protein